MRLRLFFCLLITPIVLTACLTTKDQAVSEFELNPDEIAEGEIGEGKPGEAPRYDPLYLSSLLDDFIQAPKIDREALGDDLAAMGKQVLPAITRAMAKDIPNGVRVDLLRLKERIASQSKDDPESTQPDTMAEEGESSEDKPSDPNNESPPPSVVDNIDAPEDLVDVGFDQLEVDAFISNRYNTAKRAFNEKDFDRAIELCKAILTLTPQTRHRRKVLQLLLDAETGEQTDRHLAGTLGFERSFARFSKEHNGTLDKAIKLSLFLTNVGSNALTIDLGEGGEGKESILSLALQLTEDSATDYIATEGRISLPLVGEKVRLEAGESHRFSIALKDLSGVSPGGGKKRLVSIVSALGSLRPMSLTIHGDDNIDRRVFRPILLARDEVVVLPSGFDVAFAERAPVDFVRQNIETLDIAALQMAHVFITSKQKREVLNLLLDTNLRQAALKEVQARLALASRLSGRDYSIKIEDWIEWWQNNRFRY